MNMTGTVLQTYAFPMTLRQSLKADKENNWISYLFIKFKFHMPVVC